MVLSYTMTAGRVEMDIFELRYNCTIIDLYDRSVIASITDSHITSDLAIRILQKALASQPQIKGELLLHSDQGKSLTTTMSN